MFNLTDCNPSQREAVTFGEGPLLLLAGPGSGKTFTITKRILWLIHEKEVAPEQILVITFTREAALSMQQRFAQTSSFAGSVNFGTFHSIFYQILLRSGRVQPGNLLNEKQKLNLIYPILKKNKECSAEIAKSFLDAIAYYKNTGEKEKTLEKIPEEWKNCFPQIYREYESARTKVRGVDFDDMLKECEELLQNNTPQREYWQKRFSHILIDEFQDINYRQYCIVRLLAERHKNVFAVGDDDQAIYSFRGARPACMQMFVREFAATQILLRTNYRSHQDIVEASLLVINENLDRFPKILEASEPNQRKEETYRGTACRVRIKEFRDAPEQMQYLLHRLKGRSTQETCAILFRTNLAMQSVAARLGREGIPYVMKEKTRNIYEHFIVQDIMSYLRIAAGTAERIDFLRVINKPFRNISREAFGKHVSLQALEDYYSMKNNDYSADCNRKAREAIRLWKRQMEFVKNAEPKLAVTFVCKACGYERYLRQRANVENNEKTQEWEEILNYIVEEAGHFKTAKEWQEAQETFGEQLRKGVARESGDNAQAADGAVRLLTVHASKGLEFDSVWIPDCNEKNFPHGNGLDPEHIEEERRIFYVAMTRAKKDLELLCLTGTAERPRFPSRFLIPLNRYRR